MGALDQLAAEIFFIANLTIALRRHALIVLGLASVAIASPDGGEDLVLPSSEERDEASALIEPIELCFVLQEVKRNVLVDALLDPILIHQLHLHLIDDAQGAKRVQHHLEVFVENDFALDLPARSIDIFDLVYKGRHCTVFDATTVSAGNHGADYINVRQRGHIGQGHPLFLQCGKQLAVGDTCTERDHLSLFVYFDILEFRQVDLDAVSVSNVVERMSGANDLDILFPVRLDDLDQFGDSRRLLVVLRAKLNVV